MDSPSQSKTITVSNGGDQQPAVVDNNIPVAVASFPGEKQTSGDAALDHFVSVIRDGWRKHIETILLQAKHCAEARRTLDPLQKQKLYRRLPFKQSMFSKLADVGESRALFAANVRKHLPSNWSLIYLLRNLSGEELEAAISQKVLTPKATRNELAIWLAENSSHRKEDRRRSAQNDAHHEDLLQSLTMAFWASKQLTNIWASCPEAVRIRFARTLTGR
jgi:hypothetical protein